ncbi:hypothetical protein EJD97_018292 [Solanum chilense]|uniref:Uncharacterized protein n=1 Tax=Solanum chilense TaxID=4083 RepID=A0A6N2B3T0_SOLCI|nr:hypothetical protein EJD97_018292 [Solanum chilense]
MPPHYLINIKSRIIVGFVGRLHKDKVSRLSKYVQNNPYGVMTPSSPQKNNHEVHIYGLPLPSRNLNNLSQTTRLKMLCLNLLTIRTLSHIFCNVLIHVIPPIYILKIMIHFGGTWMYGIFGTMVLYHNPGPQIIHIWYT